MEITELLQNESTLLLIKAEDLQAFADRITSKFLPGQSDKSANKKETEQPISQTEAVQFLGKSRQTLIKWRKKGFITAYHLGGRIYYKPSELLSALEKL